MNIISRTTSHCDRDPFATSDRNHGFRKGPGKGDAHRSIGASFRDNFPASMGNKRKLADAPLKKGKRIFRYA